MKRVASPRGWPKKVFSDPGVPGEAESFVRLDAMVVPCGSGRGARVRTRPVGGWPAPAGPAVHPHAPGAPLRVTERRTAATGIHASTRVHARRGPATGRFPPEPARPAGRAGGKPARTRKRPSASTAPKVPVVQKALVHHTAGQCPIWKDLRQGSQVPGEPRSLHRRFSPGSHPHLPGAAPGPRTRESGGRRRGDRCR